MSEVINNIIMRRSCKSFQSNMVPDEIINQIVQAGLYAASGMGKQSPIILVVTNKEKRDILSRLNTKYDPQKRSDPFYNAPVVLAVLAQSVIFCGQFIHAILFCSLLLRLLSFDFSLRIFLAQAGQYLDAPEPGTYSTPHTVQFLAGIAAHRFVGMICNSSTKPMNL